MKRRDFMKALPLGVAAAGIPFAVGGFSGTAFGKGSALDAILNGTDQTDRVLVLINLAGGNDGLNTVIPFQDGTYDTARPSIGFVSSAQKATLASNVLSSQNVDRADLALNPAFSMKYDVNPSFYDMFKAGKVAVVNNVGYPNPNRSHFRSTDIWNTASDSNTVLTTGWLGRWLQNKYPSYPLGVQSGEDPIAISIGGALNPVFQGEGIGMGLAVSDPSKYTSSLPPGNETLPATNAGNELGYVRNIYLQSDIYGSRFTSLFPGHTAPKNKVKYPTSYIAQQLQKVAWCVALGMKTKVYFVQLGGFDTHINQHATDPTVTGQALLHMQLGQAISAFQADMEAAGMADRVVGMTYSEFGRRVNENASLGTDHGTCAPQFLFGSQINGEVYSSNPDLTNLDTNSDLIAKVDFRQLYTSVLGDWFGTSQALRKSILMDKTSTGEQFAFNIPINGTSKVQSLIKTPFNGVTPSQELDFVMKQNYPNPFSKSTTITFALAKTMQVNLRIFNDRGDQVTELASGTMGRGEHQFTFGGDRLSSGTYIARLEAGDNVVVKQMKLIK